jgi:hypothetical protein
VVQRLQKANDFLYKDQKIAGRGKFSKVYRRAVVARATAWRAGDEKTRQAGDLLGAADHIFLIRLYLAGQP